MTRFGLHVLACAAFGALTLLPNVAAAGGFEVPDQGARAVGRGGAYAVNAGDLTALHYNPGKLAALGGTRLLYSHNLLFHRTSYQRSALSDAWGMDAGTEFELAEGRDRLFPLGAFGVVGSDFGLKNWMFALGAYGPSAIGRHDYADYGPQSFMLTKMDVVVIYYSLAVAWQLPKKFGVGVTLQYVDLPRMNYGLVVDSTPTPALDPVPDDASTQLITDLQLQDRVGFTALLGLWYRPHPRVELGAGGRLIPVKMSAEGGVATDKSTLLSDDVTAKLDFQLPVQLRGGIRYIHPLRKGPDAKGDEGERFDVELDVFWENWSQIDAYRIDFEGAINGQPIADQVIPKKWRDTLSVRLGGDVNLLDGHLTLRTGGYFETGASHPDFAHLDFPSFNRGGVGGGITGSIRGVALTVGYMHIFQQPQESTELSAKGFQVRPLAGCPDRCDGLSGVPANAGVFRSNMDILALSLDVHFNELFPNMGKKRREKSSRRSAAGQAAKQPSAEPSSATPTP
ncbi:MAG TPA: outer membrane protein transport protein [Enhygromyxa sp.]|nr:outer membrane protein transport protein [Enhygromyxa sp.]